MRDTRWNGVGLPNMQLPSPIVLTTMRSGAELRDPMPRFANAAEERSGAPSALGFPLHAGG